MSKNLVGYGMLFTAFEIVMLILAVISYETSFWMSLLLWNIGVISFLTVSTFLILLVTNGMYLLDGSDERSDKRLDIEAAAEILRRHNRLS